MPAHPLKDIANTDTNVRKKYSCVHNNYSITHTHIENTPMTRKPGHCYFQSTMFSLGWLLSAIVCFDGKSMVKTEKIA